MHEKRCRPDLVIDLSGVKELNCIKLEQGRLHIGAMSTFTRLKEDKLVGQYAPCLAQAAAAVGSAQIRNTATIGGNIGNASPAGDAIPALMALEAVIRVLDGAGRMEERTVDQIITGPGKTSLKCDQIIAEIVFPVLGDTYRSAFVKVGSRSTVTIAKLNMAVVVKHDAASNTVADARVGMGAIAVKAFRDTRVESLLNGRKADPDLARVLGEELCATVQRAIPGRHSEPYKKEAIKGLAQDAWTKLFPVLPGV
jgi:CO/xanthine dehydrogenase FAD-binding subunit